MLVIIVLFVTPQLSYVLTELQCIIIEVFAYPPILK